MEHDDLLSSRSLNSAPCRNPGNRFVLEITEGVLVEDSVAVHNLLDEIVAAGIGLHLDDFGTGYSSLSYLHRFPFQSIKIDRSFVQGMNTDPKSVKVVASIVCLAHSLDMDVIAEGVEPLDQEALIAVGGV
ncbi:MAG: EAL domain-containing protein [Bryocella sp.]